VTWRGRRVSFQAPIPQIKPGEWGEVIVPFSSLGGTIFGRSVRGAKFDRAAVKWASFLPMGKMVHLSFM